jgi:hypothetical protein
LERCIAAIGGRRVREPDEFGRGQDEARRSVQSSYLNENKICMRCDKFCRIARLLGKAEFELFHRLALKYRALRRVSKTDFDESAGFQVT